MLHIGLDFDGVISDCGSLKSEATKIIFGKDISPALFKREIIIGQNILTEEEYAHLQRIIYETREFGLTMKPVKGALTHTEKLQKSGHRVKIITSRGDKGKGVAQEWLARSRFPEIEMVALGHGISKRDAAGGLDIFIDDDLEKLLPLTGAVPHLFLFSWPYNTHQDMPDGIQRVSSWIDFFAHIERIAS